ncbi:hypothetical protein N7532_008352 [Penicillium argentinense]|uniref:CBM21 domain-containing protein n=1 Tax=Penicillium argentinense TaxID=1131581 RepID=A0A9W9K1J0_9EURO|nr:uncharacterized protein N7532_008352 [Penicillium argentinense]KAJ5089668.1 hypothetical protein N7532_008352 [Penicillium argentinense]
MPYTAPLKSLLSAQHIEYCDSPEARAERPGLVRSVSARVQGSRSYSSTSYVRRHRRSPSICNKSTSPSVPATTEQCCDSTRGGDLTPESAPNSDEESSPYGGDGIKLEELEAAVRSIEQHKESSPERTPEKMRPTEELGTDFRSSSCQPSAPAMELKIPKPNHIRLSKEARKIAHSRSATETAIDYKREEALTSSPDDSDADLSPKPPMVRKKSGELVRPALRPPAARRRPSSMPGTPVYAKAVHFDSQLEHIRHFLQLDRPLAVSAETSPVETHDADGEFPFGRGAGKSKSSSSWEWELRLSNFPTDLSSRANSPVRLERLFLSADKNTLIGSVAVANLDFHKHVAARFTFDYWRTVSEVSATYCHDVRSIHAHDGCDRFTFEIKLEDQAKLENKTMFVCIRYTSAGQEFWDNNGGVNYQADFLKSPKATVSNNKPATTGARPALPRSRSFTGSHSRPHSMPVSFDDLPDVTKNTPFSNPFNSAKSPPLSRATSDDIDTVGPPKRREKPSPQAFGNRYDFGASLTAAMRTKPPVDRTTLTARARSGQTSEANPASPVVNDAETGSGRTSPVSDEAREDLKPSSLVSSKPCLESSVYKELVDKYCFYGSPKASPPKPQSYSVNVNGEAASRYFANGTPSPPLSPRSPAPLEPAATGGSRENRPASSSPRTSPRASPSPMSFRHSYHHSLPNGFMKDPQSSPVIRGEFDVSLLEMDRSVDSFSYPPLAQCAYAPSSALSD